MTPAEIVVRFGDPASINCSTSVPNDLGMGWEAPFGSKQTMFSPFVTWTVEKLEDWTIQPLCYINLQDNGQCSVMPTITVYSEYKSTDYNTLSSVFISCKVFDT